MDGKIPARLVDAHRATLNLQGAPVLIAGCGDLGCELGRRLMSENIAVTGLRRSGQPLPYGIPAIQADVTVPQSLQSLADINPAVLVYSVAADASSDDSYRRHYVDGLRNLLTALSSCATLRHVFFVSSTRVYGQQGRDLLDENTPTLPADFGGRRLLEAETLLQGFSVASTVLRLSGIYGPGRTRMLRLAQEPASWPETNSWTNRIHRDDAAAFIAMLIGRVLAGKPVVNCYLVTDSEPAPQYAVLTWLAQKLGIDVSAVAMPPPDSGKRLSNARMLQTGFHLTYPDYRAGYSALLKTNP